jgi:hypothetical protein
MLAAKPGATQPAAASSWQASVMAASLLAGAALRRTSSRPSRASCKFDDMDVFPVTLITMKTISCMVVKHYAALFRDFLSISPPAIAL